MSPDPAPPPGSDAPSNRPDRSAAGAVSVSWKSLLRGNVGLLALASLLNDASSEMVYPLLPVFLVGTLGAGVGFLGLVEGVADSTSAVLKLWSGVLSDRLRRRKGLVVSGYGLAALTRPLLAVAQAGWQVLGLRFVDRVGKGIRGAPRDALLAESVAPEQQGRAFGLHRAADHLGAVIGPLLGAALMVAFAGRIRWVFWVAAVPGVLAAVLLWVRLRDVPREAGGGNGPGSDPAPATQPGGRPPASAPWKAPTSFRMYLLALLVFTLGNASDAFLLLRATDLGVPAAAIPLLWAVHNLSKMVWNLPGGALADRVSPRRLVALGWGVYALVYAGFALASSAGQVWGLMVVYGLFYGLTEAPEKTLVARMAPPHARGRAFGQFHFVVGLGALPASVLFGALWQWRGAEVAFSTGAGLALVAGLLLLVGRRDRAEGRIA